MSLPTPQEFAQSLGFEPGMDLGPARVLGNREMGPVQAISAKLLRYDQPEATRDALWLGSLYLPSLLRTFFLNDFDPNESDHLEFWHGLSSLLLLKVFELDIARFVRAQPEEFNSFFHITVKRLLALGESGNPFAGHLFQPFLVLSSWCISGLSMTLETTTAVPIISGNVPGGRGKRHYHSKEADLPRLRRLRPIALPENRDHFTRCVEWLEMSTGPLRGQPIQENGKLSFTAMTCGLYPDAVYDPRRCEKPEKGMEMLACKRCMCVRYCSRAHQKKDWKTHKPLCFSPGW